MTTAAIADALTQHVVRGWEDQWPLVTAICKCGEETTCRVSTASNMHLAVEEIHARHQASMLQDLFGISSQRKRRVRA